MHYLKINDSDKKKIGYLIHVYRTQQFKHLSQNSFLLNEYNEPICTRQTLSKIEQGVIIKNDSIYEELLKKVNLKFNTDYCIEEFLPTSIFSDLLNACDYYNLEKLISISESHVKQLNPFKEYIFFHEYYECFKWIYTYYSSFELPTLQSTEYIISLKNIINSNLYEVMMDLVFKKRTISGMIGTGSLAHNRREFIAENVDSDRVQLNICYQNENLKEVYKELFDEAVERYNIGKRKDRQITNYYEKIRQGKQEKLFHEVIFQIGNREDMAVGTAEGDLAVKILDEYVKDFQKRNATLRVFGCYLHQDESTPHLHIDFIPYVTDWKGKGMDTRVSLKQALKSLGFQGGNKHDTELNQWMNHEKKVLAEIAKQHGIEWEQKGTHEEHLDVYNFKKKERKKEVQELEQEKEYLTAENEELTAQIAEFRADIQILKDDKEQANREKQEAEQRAEDAEKEVKSLEERRDVLQPIMDNASKEIKEYGMIKTFLPEAGTFERAVPYRENKIKPLFIKMKNQIAALAGKVVELNKTIESWKNKYQKSTEKCDDIQTQLDDVRKENGKLSNDNQRLQEISDRYDRVVRILGMETVEDVVQQDIKEQRALEEKRRMEQMPKGSVLKQLEWATQKSQIENQQRKKNKTKYKGLEI